MLDSAARALTTPLVHRAALAAVALLTALCWLITQHIREPYPSLMMPSFRGAPGAASAGHVRYEIELDGQRYPASRLLDELPVGPAHHKNVVAILEREAAAGDREVVAWIVDRLPTTPVDPCAVPPVLLRARHRPDAEPAERWAVERVVPLRPERCAG